MTDQIARRLPDRLDGAGLISELRRASVPTVALIGAGIFAAGGTVFTVLIAALHLAIGWGNADVVGGLLTLFAGTVASGLGVVLGAAGRADVGAAGSGTVASLGATGMQELEAHAREFSLDQRLGPTARAVLGWLGRDLPPGQTDPSAGYEEAPDHGVVRVCGGTRQLFAGGVRLPPAALALITVLDLAAAHYAGPPPQLPLAVVRTQITAPTGGSLTWLVEGDRVLVGQRFAQIGGPGVSPTYLVAPVTGLLTDRVKAGPVAGGQDLTVIEADPNAVASIQLLGLIADTAGPATVRWTQAWGAVVQLGQNIAMVETDGVAVPVTAWAGGILGPPLVNAGEQLSPGIPLVIIWKNELGVTTPDVAALE